MGTKVLVGGSGVLASQLQDFFRQIADGSITGQHLQLFLDHKDPWLLENIIIDWSRVYESLGMSKEWLSESVKITEEPHPSFWDVYAIKGVTSNKVIQAFRDLGVVVYLHTRDLDKNVSTNDRDPAKDGSYRVRFMKTVEADPELKGKSADTLTTEGIKGITLLERLLLELGYFLATGDHLDVENVTLCSGSRYSDGHVPSVRWYVDDRRLCVLWDYPSDSNSNLRARAVVS